VKFVNLFRRHDKPWLNKRVKSVNLGLDRALLGHDRSHISVVDTSLLLRQDFTTHGLHLNSREKKKLTHLIAKSLDDNGRSAISSIPVICNARASPFLA
jgi:hypothetical protein